MNTLIVATGNAGKLKEIRNLLGDQILLKSLADFPDIPEILEDGDTFEANAIKKAITVARATGIVTLGDDSGLQVDALNGAPGIYSARFAGEEATDSDNNAKLLNLLTSIPHEKRTARFRCVLAMATPDETVHTAEGQCEGFILTEPRGTHGFGYDPLFYLPELNATVAELPVDQKNKISHRGHALQAAAAMIRSLLD
jgi:XTP/dITP diphosphohydrolase